MGFTHYPRQGPLTRLLVSTPVLRVSCWAVDGLAYALLSSDRPRSWREAMDREV